MEAMKRLASRIVDEARRAGADTVEVTLAKQRKCSVEVRRGEVEELIDSVSNGIDIKLSIDRRTAVVSSSDLSPECLSALIAESIELARVMDRDEYAGLPDPGELGAGAGESDLAVYDPDSADAPIERKTALALELERRAVAMDNRIILDGSSYTSRVRTIVLANSLGFCEGWRRTHNRLAVSCAVEDRPQRSENTGKRQSSFWYSSAIRAADLEDTETIARRAVERTIRKIGARKPRTCEVPVVFDPFTTRKILKALSRALRGRNVYRKSSFLVDRMGERIGSPLVTIIDDALLPGKLGTKPFDDEGARGRRTVAFDGGALSNYLCDSYAARKLGVSTTGNAGGITNFYLEPGRSSPREIIASVDRGLYLTSMSGPGANHMTGDFSQGGQGIWIEGGELSYPVDEFTVASSFPEMLAGIALVGDDVDWRDEIGAPTIKIEKMTLSGA